MNHQNSLSAMYADISACLLAITNALSAKGVLTKEEMTAAAQERLLAMQPDGKPNAFFPYELLLLQHLARALTRTRSEQRHGMPPYLRGAA